jgi:hypothetical protein
MEGYTWGHSGKFRELTGLEKLTYQRRIPASAISLAGKQKGKEENVLLWPKWSEFSENLSRVGVLGENVPESLELPESSLRRFVA